MASPIQLLDLSQARVRPSEGAGTTTLTLDDFRHQVFNLSAIRTCVLPSTGVKKGMKWFFENYGTGQLRVQSSNGANIGVVQGNLICCVALQDAPTSLAHWDVSGNVEYCSSSNGAWDAAAAGTDTVYGTVGSAITGSLTTNRDKVCRFLLPIKVTDQFVIEYYSNLLWIPSHLSQAPFQQTTTATTGAYVSNFSAGQADVTISFRQFAYATGANWSTAVPGTFWRLKKIS